VTDRIETHAVTAPDGVKLACHRVGEGPAVLLLHGFLFNARLNFFDTGIAEAIAAAGFSVIAPDLRGHGDSGAPDDPALYPQDIIPSDARAVLDAFQIADFALVGYSLGARMAARMIANGATPRRLVLAGMGDHGVLNVARRQAHFEDLIRHGPAAANSKAGALVHAFMQKNNIQAGPALHVLASQRDTSPAELAQIACPTLVLCGVDDHDNGASGALARLIPSARLALTPGDHLSAAGKSEFRAALTEFLKGDLQ
jgi:pimeloyl-ACP methyl ester carboxylesterase